MDTKQKIELNEAPASVTYTITSKGGFNALFTIRDVAGTDLLEKMEQIEKTLVEKEYKPQVRIPFGQKKEIVYVEGKVCPLCKGRLVERATKAGKKYHACENGKYDFATKSVTGCKFVDWLEPKAEVIEEPEPEREAEVEKAVDEIPF